MVVTKKGLVCDKDGRLACDIGQLEKAEDVLKEVESKEVGFSKKEVEYFGAVVKEQIKEFEAKKRGKKGRKKAREILEEVEEE